MSGPTDKHSVDEILSSGRGLTQQVECVFRADKGPQFRKKQCVDAIFDERYWIVQQDNPGADEYSHIRYLRPQFRRLGRGK